MRNHKTKRNRLVLALSAAVGCALLVSLVVAYFSGAASNDLRVSSPRASGSATGVVAADRVSAREPVGPELGNPTVQPYLDPLPADVSPSLSAQEALAIAETFPALRK